MTAPGQSNRNGISLAELFAMFPDDAAAERWFCEARWPSGVACPHCGSMNVQAGAAHKMPYRCRDCRQRFSTRTGTTRADSKLGYQKWAIAIYRVTTSLKGVSSMKLPPRPRDHAEVSVAPRAPHPASMGGQRR